MYPHIKSFVKRQRSLRTIKEKIYTEIWPKYGLPLTSLQISPEKIFKRSGSLTLEIGFGNGETLFSLAKACPEQDFIGIEVYRPGIANLLNLLKDHPLNNLRIYNEDAVLVLKQAIPEKSLDKVLILFPDPWPKQRHHKRRLIQPEFVAILQNKLKPNGILHIATDWENYAAHIKTVLKNNPNFSTPNSLNPLPLFKNRPVVTKFEQRGKERGYQNFELLFVKRL